MWSGPVDLSGWWIKLHTVQFYIKRLDIFSLLTDGVHFSRTVENFYLKTAVCKFWNLDREVCNFCRQGKLSFYSIFFNPWQSEKTNSAGILIGWYQPPQAFPHFVWKYGQPTAGSKMTIHTVNFISWYPVVCLKPIVCYVCLSHTAASNGARTGQKFCWLTDYTLAHISRKMTICFFSAHPIAEIISVILKLHVYFEGELSS